ncbi:alanine racemase [Magnetospirillum sp. 64-120]|uniref:alanine racemase n=1 Tax=Magnetospirillum sp. 64-120 TaxID=1895778 RepID=UPI000929FA62|nr:alanine racemase [Magnetospirillum sp. 64-120]OJX79309.1 MAG: alanine racemase [Magnetospirillum sp. 64-120]
MTAHDRATGILTVDLDAIAANWRFLAARAPGAEAAGVVKADGYGLGAIPVAKTLAAAGCKTFFVATIDEGIALRPHLGAARIFILGGPLPGTGADFTEHGLVPVLNSPDQVGLWSGFARSHGTPLPAALHLDTGMSRLGLDAHAVGLLAADKRHLDGIDTVLVMSHMACADEPGHAKNAEQLTAFNTLSAQLAVNAPRSLAASSTIFLGSGYLFDLIRPGAALYGLNPVPGQPNPLRPVVRLSGRILQVRDVDTPQTVGYGATHRFASKGRVATVAFGYADGLFRSLGNRGFGVIGGVKVPVVGRISMDLTTFDVSAAPADAVHPGAMIELIGPGHDADQLAEEAGTIGYEVLTSLGRRYLRDYVGGAA